MKKAILVTIGLLAISSIASHAQSVDIGAGATVTTGGNVTGTPQTQADVNATTAWMYQQIVNLQAALSNQQAQLTTIEGNKALTLGQFMQVVPSQTGYPWLPNYLLRVIGTGTTARLNLVAH